MYFLWLLSRAAASKLDKKVSLYLDRLFNTMYGNMQALETVTNDSSPARQKSTLAPRPATALPSTWISLRSPFSTCQHAQLDPGTPTSLLHSLRNLIPSLSSSLAVQRASVRNDLLAFSSRPASLSLLLWHQAGLQPFSPSSLNRLSF
jgi:hypothetical protein